MLGGEKLGKLKESRLAEDVKFLVGARVIPSTSGVSGPLF